MNRSIAPNDPDADEPASSKPDVSADRAAPAKPEGRPDHAKSPPLAIHQIEDLEDDAKGG